MNQVMTPYQQRFGNPYLYRATLSVWKKVCLCGGIWRILLGAVEHIPNSDLSCGCRFHWTITTQFHAETVSGTWSTTFDHVWPQEGRGDEVILTSVCNWIQWYMRLCHKACALLLEWFLVVFSHGKVLFSDECAIYFCSLSWNVFWGKTESLLHAWDVRPPTTHDDSAGVTASCIIDPYFFDGTVSRVTCVKCGITLYQSQATMGLFNRCHFSKIQHISPWLCVNSSMNH